MEENGKELMPESLLEAIPYLEDLEGLPLESLTAVVRYSASGNRSWTVVARRKDTDPILYGWIGGAETPTAILVPEPGTLSLLALGGLVLFRRIRR